MRSIFGTIGAVRSPMAWIELMANSSPSAMQAEGSKVMPKCRKRGRENHFALLISDRSTMPITAATAYPAAMPSRIEASLQMPRP